MFPLVWYSMFKWRQIIRKPYGLRVFFAQASIFIDFEPSVRTSARRSDCDPEVITVAGMCVLKCWENPRIWMLDHDDHDDHDCPFLLMAVNWSITWYYQRVSNVAMENPVQMEVHMGKASING